MDSKVKYSPKLTVETTSKAAKKRLKSDMVNDLCNIGVYQGRNVMGKILTICKNCLLDSTTSNIDYNLLNNKNIHILGERIEFV